MEADRAALEARLAAATPVFEAWLADERRAEAKGLKPDPFLIVEQDRGSADKLCWKRSAPSPGRSRRPSCARAT